MTTSSRRTLKVRSGGLRCKERKKKCDEQHPICKACVRLGQQCRWPNADADADADAEDDGDDADGHTRFSNAERGKARRPTSQTASDRSHPAMSIAGYDDPSVLRSSATSVLQTERDKTTFLYLCETGASILRYPTHLLPATATVNPFRLGFQMARHFQPQVEAYLALGAAHRLNSSASPNQSSVVQLEYYARTIRGLREELQHGSPDGPAEWTCAVAAILCIYELVAFSNVNERLKHLRGYYQLVETRNNLGLRWGPFQVLLEHYIHSFTITSLFHFDAIAAHKGIRYVDDQISLLNSNERGLGKEIVGVPPELTAAAYRLAVLSHHDVHTSPWDVELLAVTRLLRNWHPGTQVMIMSSRASGLLITAKLYYFACSCFVLFLQDSTILLTDPRISTLINSAHNLLESFPVPDRPYNCTSWPLIVLGLFSSHEDQKTRFRQPLEALVSKAGVKGYQTAIDFLDHVWQEGLGPRAIYMPELLSQVSI